MITYHYGNILDDNAFALVNPVNCVGVMGKGLALQFKEKYPEMFKIYATDCYAEKVAIGKMHVVTHKVDDTNNKLIINFPTKNSWREQSKLEYIEKGLLALDDIIRTYEIPSIAIPPLGCDNGGLNLVTIMKLMQHILKNVNCDIRIYIPY